MTRGTVFIPGVFSVWPEGLSLCDACLPELSGGYGVHVSGECEQEAVEDGNGANQPPGQVKLGAGDFRADIGDFFPKGGCGDIDLAVKLRPDDINILSDQIDVFPDQIDFPVKALFGSIDIGLRRNATRYARVDGQRDGFGLFLFDACVAKALDFGDCVERCFGHVRSLLILPKDIDHSRPDCQRPRRCGIGNGGTSFTSGSVGNPPFVTASGVA